MSFNIFRESVDPNDYIIVTYDLESTIDIRKAAFDLAIGQSVGNPNIRNAWETDDLFEKHACLVLDGANEGQKRGHVNIAFPVVNTDWDSDGISHLLCQIMGGQADIGHITRSRVVNIDIPTSVSKHFFLPKYGSTGFRRYTGQYDKPFFGGIIKPKTGLPPVQLLELVKQLVDGGVDFIKEDEILSNPAFCTLKDRVPLISNYIQNCGRKVIYCFSINADPHVVMDRVRYIASEGGNGVHINFWSGLGVYNSIRQLDLPLFLHFQKSGDKVITHPGNAYGISWYVLCKLAAMSGIDSIHAGMLGGYMDTDTEELKMVMGLLKFHDVVPALSCGMHPGLVNYVTSQVGNDYMANVGGALHGHPQGTLAGCKAMRQAIDKTEAEEYHAAITAWGLTV